MSAYDLRSHLIAAMASAWSGTAAAVTWASPLAFLGVPAPVALMAFAGAAAGLILQPPSISRREMFGWTLGFTFLAICLTTIAAAFIPNIKEIQPAVAGAVAAFMQSILPAARRRITKELSGRGATDLAKEDLPP